MKFRKAIVQAEACKHTIGLIPIMLGQLCQHIVSALELCTDRYLCYHETDSFTFCYCHVGICCKHYTHERTNIANEQ